MRLIRICAPIFFISVSGFAAPIYTGGTGAISMGVAPYGGAPNVGGPTYIANNFTGLNDILSSPGLGTLGGYLTASPVLANNIATTGVVALPVALAQAGGGNGAGSLWNRRRLQRWELRHFRARGRRRWWRLGLVYR